MVSYSHFLKNFSQFIVIHTFKCFSIVNEAKVVFFVVVVVFVFVFVFPPPPWNSLALPVMQWMLAI